MICFHWLIMRDYDQYVEISYLVGTEKSLKWNWSVMPPDCWFCLNITKKLSSWLKRHCLINLKSYFKRGASWKSQSVFLQSNPNLLFMFSGLKLHTSILRWNKTFKSHKPFCLHLVMPTSPSAGSLEVFSMDQECLF